MDKTDNKSRQPSNRKLLPSLLIVVVIATLVVGLITPRKAQALPGEPMAAAVFKEIKDAIRWTYDKVKYVKDKIEKSWAGQAFKNGLRVFLGKVAEDTAIWISSAGTGQKPLFITNPHYWRDLSNAAAGDFIDTIAKEQWGISICEPVDINKKLQLDLGLRNLVNPLNFCQDKCNATFKSSTAETLDPIKSYLDNLKIRLKTDKKTIIDCIVFDPNFMGPTQSDFVSLSVQACYKRVEDIYNQQRQLITGTRDNCLAQCNKGRRKAACSVTQAWNNVTDLENLSQEIQTYFAPEQNDIGQLLTLYKMTGEKAQENIDAAKTILDGTVSSITDKLGTSITTPASLVQKKAEQPIETAGKAEETPTGSLLADTVGIFTNTLTQRIMDRFFKGKCGLNPAACEGPSQTGSKIGQSLFGSNAPQGIAAARLQFSSLARIEYKSGDPAKAQVSVSSNLVSGGFISAGFGQAIEEKMTLREAIDKKLIDGNITFGFDASDTEAEKGIPFRTIVYLRKYRVVPVGWELAALHIRDVDQRAYGLKELMDLYDFCGQDALHGIPDIFNEGEFIASPFCGLIDPGWVLTAPQTYCRRMGAGDEIISRQFSCSEDTDGSGGSPNCSLTDIGGGDLGSWVISRNPEVCVDEPSCVKEDEKGSCLAYGYCYEEKPIWRFNGDECPGYYASCRTYTNEEGIKASYLRDTLDLGVCNADNARCRGYCADSGYNAVDDTYNCVMAGVTNRYFDGNSLACKENAVGCTELIGTENGSNLLANGGFSYFDGMIDDGSADTFGYCSGSGTACANDSSCLASEKCIGWKTDDSVTVDAVTSDNTGADTMNTTALKINPDPVGQVRHIVDLGQPPAGLTATFSYYAKSLGADCTARFGIVHGAADNSPIPLQQTLEAEYTASWQRFSISVAFPGSTPPDSWITVAIAASCPIAVDAAKLEIGPQLTVYTDYQTVNEVTLKIPQTTLLTNGDFVQDDGTNFFNNPIDPAGDNATAGDSQPDGWGISGNGTIDSIGHTDTRSLKLATAAGGRAYSHQLVPIEYGKAYEVSGWVKTNLVDGAGDQEPFGAILTECVFGAGYQSKCRDSGAECQDDSECPSSSCAEPYETYFADDPSACLISNYDTHLKPSSLSGDGEFIVEGDSDWKFLRYTLTANNPDIGFMRVLCLNKSDNASGLDNNGSGDVWCDDIKVTEDPVSCSKQEVGCEQYRPVGPGSSVNGVVRPDDYCPANQVGCRQFREAATEHIPIRPMVEPVHFIDTSGEVCTAAQVGCEEYTNLDEEAAGGESRAYFTQIRQCVNETDPNAGNFYSWEGSDDSGFQLRAYKLLKSNFPNTGFDPDGAAGPMQPETGVAPCTNLSVGTTTTAPVCLDDATNIATCMASDIDVDPDCTEIFGEGGQVFYRKRSRTIYSSVDCRPYRNTIDAQAGVDNIYTILATESTQCAQAAAGCRQYKGTTAGATRTVYTENFEAGSVNGWTGSVSYSNESVNVGGHSMKIPGMVVPEMDLSDSLQSGGTYSLKFWYKGSGANIFSVNMCGPGCLGQQDITSSTSWAQYELGPFYMNGNGPYKILMGSSATGWIDNIELVESINSVYRVKGTTTSCDAQYAGCRLYADRTNETVALTGFSNLCSSRAVGCEAFTVTQNSDYPFARQIQDNPMLRTPGDQTLSYVHSAANRCRTDEQGCRLFGLPTYNTENVATSWAKSAIIDDPDLYSLAMCLPEEEWCSEYSEEISNSTEYFKNPENRTCEYRQDAAQAGKLVDGWFLTGTNTPCPSNSMTCKGGALAGEPCWTADQQAACLDADGYCIPYPADGEDKEVNLYCAATCTTGGDKGVGGNPGKQCFANSECSNICVGGTDAGQACVKDADCTDGVCEVGLCGDDGSPRPLCDGRRFGDPYRDQEECLDDGGICAPLPSIGRPGKSCTGGTRNGQICLGDADCPSGACSTNWVGVCTEGAAGCTEFRDPLDPPQQPKYPSGCNVECTYASDRIGNDMLLGTQCKPGAIDDPRPGCKPYYVLRQSITSQLSECNSMIDFQIGCQPFFDTANPITNFIGG